MAKMTAAGKKLEKAAEVAWTELQQAIVLHGRKRGDERKPVDLARARYERAIAERAGKVTQPPVSERELYYEQGRDEIRSDVAGRLAAVTEEVLASIVKDAEWDDEIQDVVRPLIPVIANRVLAGMGYKVAPEDLAVDGPDGGEDGEGEPEGGVS